MLATASRIIFGFSDWESSPRNLKNLTSLNKKSCLYQEKFNSNKLPKYIKGNRMHYEKMGQDYYISQLMNMIISFCKKFNPRIHEDINHYIKAIRKKIISFGHKKGYTILVDNYIKIIMILQRARNRQPIIIMGESGCGKTYLIRFLVEVLMADFAFLKMLPMYFSRTAENFAVFIRDSIKLALQNPKKVIWLFFDEFNTSNLQSFINEIMSERIFSFNTFESIILITFLA